MIKNNSEDCQNTNENIISSSSDQHDEHFDDVNINFNREEGEYFRMYNVSQHRCLTPENGMNMYSCKIEHDNGNSLFVFMVSGGKILDSIVYYDVDQQTTLMPANGG